jgi:hypothetical protein
MKPKTSKAPKRIASTIDRTVLIDPNKNAAGYLMVGIDPYRGEVVINLDHDRTGHITFSPSQARQLASLLNRKADELQGL